MYDRRRILVRINAQFLAQPSVILKLPLQSLTRVPSWRTRIRRFGMLALEFEVKKL